LAAIKPEGRYILRLAFVSNFLNHHQVHLCNQFYNSCEEFYFIATEKIPPNRLRMGYEDMDSTYPYVIRMYEDKLQRHTAYYIIKNFDVVIFGSCPSRLIELRMRQNMLSFIYMERFLRNGLWHRFIPSTRKRIQDRVVKYKDKNVYVLCAGAYTSYDLYICGFMDKCYKWGYFPEVPYVNKKELMKKKDSSHSNILWAGRLMGSKCTQDVIFLARKLMKQRYNFNINIIGSGRMEKQLHMLVRILGLSEHFHFLGAMPPDKVKKYMEEANIFIFTSNYKEGWGAVVNEAMSSGCAVVASHAAGSTPYLIKHKKNGLVYQSGNINDLYRRVSKLIQSPELQYTYGTNAYDTMISLWSPQIAAERFIQIAKNILVGKRAWYRKGPCSRAYIIKEDWYPI
jgi:glycosyltransferase involved in cell wall biosynthesis